jgi:PIN domain nuclease of toxin-antitoxin system
MNGYLLDTHTWIWVQTGEADRVSRDVRKELEKGQARRQVHVSAISILELARLVSLGQRTLPCSVDDFVMEAFSDDALILLDLSPRIMIDSTRLPGTFHRDPSDRLLVATARAHGLALITRDKQILGYAKAGHVNARKP